MCIHLLFQLAYNIACDNQLVYNLCTELCCTGRYKQWIGGLETKDLELGDPRKTLKLDLLTTKFYYRRLYCIA